ncbi:MAG: hypothetical protein V7637_3368 [Mycobacteriales bacterium]|jgi:hypothetical protein
MSQLDALQTALAAEHAVIWGYAVVGAKVSAELRPQVRAADAAHRGRRDAVAGTIRRLGADPALTRASYRLPFPVADQAAALRLALHLEDGAAAAWRYVVAATDDRVTRQTAVTALTDAAIRGTGWRRLVTPAAPTVPFPGS